MDDIVAFVRGELQQNAAEYLFVDFYTFTIWFTTIEQNAEHETK